MNMTVCPRTSVRPIAAPRAVVGRARGLVIRWLVGCASLAIFAPPAASAPVCPAGGADADPPFGEVDGPPTVQSWRDLDALPPSCRLALDAPAALALALAGRFTHAGSIDDLAARLGAVSATRGLRYWSVTSGRWRELVSDAGALDAAAADATRPDFGAEEILSGRTLYFAQNDTRSWGRNVYSLRVLEASADHLSLESANESPIKLGPITLFGPRVLRGVQFIDRVDGDVWSYYGLSVVEKGAPTGSDRSLVNRQAAFYRFLVGREPDRDPPLAP